MWKSAAHHTEEASADIRPLARALPAPQIESPLQGGLIVCALPTPLTVLALCLPHIGVERIYVLLTLARFDSNNTGEIDEQQRQLKGGALVADAAITCSSMSVVSSLIIGLTHLQATFSYNPNRNYPDPMTGLNPTLSPQP